MLAPLQAWTHRADLNYGIGHVAPAGATSAADRIRESHRQALCMRACVEIYSCYHVDTGPPGSGLQM